MRKCWKRFPPPPNIDAVLAAHDQELLKLPGVVDLYVCVLGDGESPCLKVILAKPAPEIERQIPCEIEGYRVVTDICREIRPLRS